MDKVTFNQNLARASEASGKPDPSAIKKLLDDPDSLAQNPSLQPLSVFLTWARSQVPMEWIDEALASKEKDTEVKKFEAELAKVLPTLRLKNQVEVTGEEINDKVLLIVVRTAFEQLDLKSEDAHKLKTVKVKYLGSVTGSGPIRKVKNDADIIGVTLTIDTPRGHRDLSTSVKIDMKELIKLL